MPCQPQLSDHAVRFWPSGPLHPAAFNLLPEGIQPGSTVFLPNNEATQTLTDELNLPVSMWGSCSWDWVASQ